MKKKLACGCSVDYEVLEKLPKVKCGKCGEMVYDTKFCVICGNSMKMKKKCPLCTKTFQSIRDWEGHLRKIHGLSEAHIKLHSEEQKTEFAQKCARILNELTEKKA